MMSRKVCKIEIPGMVALRVPDYGSAEINRLAIVQAVFNQMADTERHAAQGWFLAKWGIDCCDPCGAKIK